MRSSLWLAACLLALAPLPAQAKDAPNKGRPPAQVAADIDRIINQRLASGKVPPSPRAEDGEFIRRATSNGVVIALGHTAADRAAIEAFADVLAGSGGPLLIASGILGLATGKLGTERDMPNPAAHPRLANAQYTLGLAARGVRTIVTRFAPTVHGSGGDHGFVATLAQIARKKGVSGHIGTGLNRWPAVHRLEAGKLVQLAIDEAPAGAVLHAVAEQGIATRDIAGAIGKFLNLPEATVPADRATEHFDWLGMFFGADAPASSDLTRKLLGWEPKHPTLLEDIATGHYPGR